MSESRAWTWRHAILKSDLPATTRHVLLTISCYMNEVGGGCYPTQEDLEQATGLTDRAVRKHISIAEDAGWIERKEHGFRGQKWRNHEYFAKWPDPLDVDERAERRSGPSDERCGTSFQKVRNEVPPILPYTSPPLSPSNQSELQLALDVVPSFQQLLILWPPGKVGNEGKARIAFGHLPIRDQAKAIAAAELTVRWHGKSKQRLHILSSYLRERVFEQFADAPEYTFDGFFRITPDRPEWEPWYRAAVAEHGAGAAERATACGFMLRPRRWPEGRA